MGAREEAGVLATKRSSLLIPKGDMMPVYEKRDYEWAVDAMKTLRENALDKDLSVEDLRIRVANLELYAQRIQVLLMEKYGEGLPSRS